ncbi:hypothetical protein ACW9KT_20140 [Hymenobacter sp. HD11105]
MNKRFRRYPGVVANVNGLSNQRKAGIRVVMRTSYEVSPLRNYGSMPYRDSSLAVKNGATSNAAFIP